ncbi:MAG: TRAP transporter substrate-binding protein [Desulfobacteraceae bacterium]|nr:MAG: TRAP transporter substrate-binding protein [Desulfobacteraceae bacterium]
MRKNFFSVVVCLVGVAILCGGAVWAQEKKDPLEQWKPKFDSSTAKYKCVVSNVSHPVLDNFAGFAIRDKLWERTKGQIYFDFKPFSMLGGEVEVLNQLQMGAIQGMAVSSIASTNLGPRFGVVNLPFLVDSYDKLEKFINSGKLFDHFLMAMDHQGIMAIDITTYGNYGWASVNPIKTIADLRKTKLRIGEAAVNKLTYKAWGVNPVVMPWPDVPIALKQGVIDSLDHTLIVCNITKKFEQCKFFTQINYAQGLFIWTFNKAWFNALPADLQKIFVDTVKEVCKASRPKAKQFEVEQIADAKSKSGVTMLQLSPAEMETLRKAGTAVHKDFSDEINKLYKGDQYRPANYLKEVQDFMGYKP